mmetsp:Transcript_8755/g.25113  ORF Transcript_8755/g.25113 Transcript_8755/m.25113 type:complete len:88 (-) Transcript_8755:136-399(-)
MFDLGRRGVSGSQQQGMVCRLAEVGKDVFSNRCREFGTVLFDVGLQNVVIDLTGFPIQIDVFDNPFLGWQQLGNHIHLLSTQYKGSK